MRRVQLVVPSRNAPQSLDSCLASVAAQRHVEVRVCVVDDASERRHTAVARRWCGAHGWQLIRNEHRQGALYSRIAGFDALDPGDDDVVVVLDGDDRFAHDAALAAIAAAHDDATWMTSGGVRAEGMVDDPRRIARARDVNDAIRSSRADFRAHREEIVAAAAYRDAPWCFWQPLSFRARLLRAVHRRDFITTRGTWFAMCTDLALTYPLVELCDGRIALLDETHAVYHIHEANEDTERSELSRRLMANLIKRKDRYRPLSELRSRP